MKVDMTREQIKFLNLVAHVFETEAGKKLLAELEKTYIFDVILPPLQHHEKYPDWWPYFREGQNSVIRTLKNQIALSKQLGGTVNE